jgi:hypothetical protein
MRGTISFGEGYTLSRPFLKLIMAQYLPLFRNAHFTKDRGRPILPQPKNQAPQYV